jgi:hypothetical protein
MLSESPQTSKTDAVVPTAEMHIQVMTLSLSTSRPITMLLIVVNILMRMSVNEDKEADALKMVWAYVGK